MAGWTEGHFHLPSLPSPLLLQGLLAPTESFKTGMFCCRDHSQYYCLEQTYQKLHIVASVGAMSSVVFFCFCFPEECVSRAG